MKVFFAAILAGLFLLMPVSGDLAGQGTACGADRISLSGATGTRWAVCIGISDYRDTDLTDLPHARNDARDVARALANQGGFGQVLALTDDRGPKDPSYPSKKHILGALNRIRSRIESGDTVVIFFSGHGVTDPGGRSFLLPADAMVRDIPRSGIPLSTIQDFMKGIRAAQRILFIDGARREIWRKGPLLEAAYPDRYLRGGVSAVFYGAKRGTFSHDHDQAPYGVFGGALVAGLQGEADRELGGDNDGVVSLMELGGYVNEKVTAWSLASGLRQSPYIRIFDAGAATLAMTGAGEEAEERVLAAVRTEEPRIPDEPPAPSAKEPERVETPAVPVAKPPAAPEEPSTPTAETGEVVPGAPAPSIDEVVSEKEEAAPVEREKPAAVAKAPPEKEETRPAPPPGPEPEPVEKAPAGAVAVPAPAPSPAQPSDERAAEFEADERSREHRMVTGEEAPTVAYAPSRKPGDAKPSAVPKAPPPSPVSLRSKPMDLPAEAVKALLMKNDFYATCWTYNGDFCNPTGEFENSFVDNGNGTVTDRRTRLMWQQDGSPASMTWPDAVKYVQELNQEGFAGHSDWRLPTVEELASVMERSWLNDDLFLDPVFGSGQKYCWSVDTKGVERAWKSNFHLGFFLDFPMSELNSVRAVRSVR